MPVEFGRRSHSDLDVMMGHAPGSLRRGDSDGVRCTAVTRIRFNLALRRSESDEVDCKKVTRMGMQRLSDSDGLALQR